MANMMRARGYTNIETVTTGSRRVLSALDGDEVVHAIFITHKTGIVDITAMLTTTDPAVGHLVIISDTISPQGLKVLYASTAFYVEVLSPLEVAQNKHDHYLVPLYYRLTDVEVVEVESRYGSRSNFPVMIYRSDAMARYFDFRPGDVLRITRRGRGVPPSYRIVMEEGQVER